MHIYFHVINNYSGIINLIYNIITLCLFILSVATGLLTYLINPGFVFKENNNNKGNNYFCPICNFNYPKNEKKYEHCPFCEICISGADHHCGIFEKCIGKKNLICFYLFPIFSIAILIIFIVSLFHHLLK